MVRIQSDLVTMDQKTIWKKKLCIKALQKAMKDVGGVNSAPYSFLNSNVPYLSLQYTQKKCIRLDIVEWKNLYDP